MIEEIVEKRELKNENKSTCVFPFVFLFLLFFIKQIKMLGVLNMNISLFIVLLIQISSITLVVGYLGNFLQNKKYLFFSAISICTYLFLYERVNIIATILLWCMLCLLVYWLTQCVYSSLFYPSLTLFIYIFSDNTATYLYSLFNMKLSLFLLVLLGAIYFLFISYGVKKLLLKKIVHDKERLKIATYVFVFTTIIYFAFICAERFPFLMQHINLANEVFIILYGVMSTLIFLTMLFIKKKEFETREQQKEMKYLIEYSEQIEKNYTELLKFRHDYKNILISLEDYIQTNDMQGLQRYFYESIKATKTIFEPNNFDSHSISNLKIKELKSIILSKLYVASQKGIEVKIVVPEAITHVDLPPVILIRMLGIILDNAIEESICIDAPKIELMIIKQENCHSFVLINQCKPNIPKLHELKRIHFTTKKGNQGLGLTTLDELVRSHENVFLETKIASEQFIQIITIHEKRKERC